MIIPRFYYQSMPITVMEICINIIISTYKSYMTVYRFLTRKENVCKSKAVLFHRLYAMPFLQITCSKVFWQSSLGTNLSFVLAPFLWLSILFWSVNEVLRPFGGLTCEVNMPSVNINVFQWSAVFPPCCHWQIKESPWYGINLPLSYVT